MNKPVSHSSLLHCQALTHRYKEGQLETEVLKGIELSIAPGEMLAVVGSSGSGKTTLLHLMGALDTPSSGTVLFKGEDIHRWDSRTQARFRNQELGFVYQFHHLLAEFTALENAAMPLLIAGASVATARAKASAILAKVGLSHRLNHRPSELSGGERQRVAIARALVNEPSLVLADEPTGNLDHASASAVYELLCELNRELGTAFVVVTHDLNLAAKLHRRVTLVSGVMAEVA
ncbi:lipoprotein-releasing ABC transporter ATP-binding protein LolD [Aeromonas cavernicola]|nr:lipoprotein-releasing ABC transporter ATP-binding protein LolD [Aeromonas cavernicola]